MTRKIFAPVDLRRRALSRAGFAVAAAIILLAVALWFEDSGELAATPAKIAPEMTAAQETANYPVYPIDAAADEIIVPVNDIVAVAAESASVSPAPDEKTSAPEAALSVTPPAAELPAKAAHPPKPLQGGYFIQLGVFDSMDNAKSLLNNIAAFGLPAHIQSRVVAGPFRNKSEAETAKRRLKGFAEGIVLPPPQKASKTVAKAVRKPTRRTAK
ncbi:MAG: SPOR domain-containing protein [Azoarcus sp.]|jgi:cell division septation protein DedD|nr:SPOR domain-containing protein [Azoarcus sp.]